MSGLGFRALGFEFWVRTRGCRVELVTSNSCSPQVAHKPTNQSAGTLPDGISVVKLLLRDIGFIERHIKLIFDLAGGSLRLREELDELSVAASLEAFGDVRADRDGGSSNLPDQSIVAGKIRQASQPIDFPPECTPSLPTLEIFESFYFGNEARLKASYPKPTTQNSKPGIGPVRRHASTSVMSGSNSTARR